MSLLAKYIKRAKETKGWIHIANIVALRHYMKEVPEKELLTAIAELNNQQSLRTLIEAGLRQPYLNAVLRRAKELQERRKGL